MYSSYSEVDPEFHKNIKPSMFPPTEEEQKWMHLDRCMRLLPHHQNTGGFFVAVFKKVTECPRLHESFAAAEATVVTETTKEVKDSTDIDGSKAVEEEKKKSEDGKDEKKEDGREEEEEKKTTGLGDVVGDEPAAKRPYSPPPDVKIKNAAFVEDPFVFLTWEKDRELFENMKNFYGFEDDFPLEQVN